ncbi:hypothetical protein KL927_000767 [Ogataea polymorpha]|nr:hypothetical protein KL927_000767 [Ogataea polymorpha]
MLVRAYSTQRPLLLDILPQRKLIKRLLFDFDARMNLRKYMPVIQNIYDNIGKDKLSFPPKVRGSDLLLFQKVLSEIRTQTHTSNQHLVRLEDELIERAAELGSRDALTIVSFRALRDQSGEYTDEDKVQAKKFIDQLRKLEHPLVYKMGGDYDFDQGRYNEAVKQYWKFVKLDPNSFLSAEVYKTMGMIYFQQNQLLRAKLFFEKSIKLAPISRVAQSHYMLGLIYEVDPLRSRYHFEMAATQGFKESFKTLGFMELNYFKNLYKAKKWFQMGAELGDHNCMIGLFDAYIQEKNWKAARRTMDMITKFSEQNGLELNMKSLRKDSVEQLIEHESAAPITQQKDKSLWDV